MQRTGAKPSATLSRPQAFSGKSASGRLAGSSPQSKRSSVSNPKKSSQRRPPDEEQWVFGGEGGPPDPNSPQSSMIRTVAAQGEPVARYVGDSWLTGHITEEESSTLRHLQRRCEAAIVSLSSAKGQREEPPKPAAWRLPSYFQFVVVEAAAVEDRWQYRAAVDEALARAACEEEHHRQQHGNLNHFDMDAALTPVRDALQHSLLHLKASHGRDEALLSKLRSLERRLKRKEESHNAQLADEGERSRGERHTTLGSRDGGERPKSTTQRRRDINASAVSRPAPLLTPNMSDSDAAAAETGSEPLPEDDVEMLTPTRDRLLDDVPVEPFADHRLPEVFAGAQVTEQKPSEVITTKLATTLSLASREPERGGETDDNTVVYELYSDMVAACSESEDLDSVDLPRQFMVRIRDMPFGTRARAQYIIAVRHALQSSTLIGDFTILAGAVGGGVRNGSERAHVAIPMNSGGASSARSPRQPSVSEYLGSRLQRVREIVSTSQPQPSNSLRGASANTLASGNPLVATPAPRNPLDSADTMAITPSRQHSRQQARYVSPRPVAMSLPPLYSGGRRGNEPLSEAIAFVPIWLDLQKRIAASESAALITSPEVKNLVRAICACSDDVAITLPFMVDQALADLAGAATDDASLQLLCAVARDLRVLDAIDVTLAHDSELQTEFALRMASVVVQLPSNPAPLAFRQWAVYALPRSAPVLWQRMAEPLDTSPLTLGDLVMARSAVRGVTGLPIPAAPDATLALPTSLAVIRMLIGGIDVMPGRRPIPNVLLGIAEDDVPESGSDYDEAEFDDYHQWWRTPRNPSSSRRRRHESNHSTILASSARFEHTSLAKLIPLCGVGQGSSRLRDEFGRLPVEEAIYMATLSPVSPAPALKCAHELVDLEIAGEQAFSLQKSPAVTPTGGAYAAAAHLCRVGDPELFEEYQFTGGREDVATRAADKSAGLPVAPAGGPLKHDRPVHGSAAASAAALMRKFEDHYPDVRHRFASLPHPKVLFGLAFLLLLTVLSIATATTLNRPHLRSQETMIESRISACLGGYLTAPHLLYEDALRGGASSAHGQAFWTKCNSTLTGIQVLTRTEDGGANGGGNNMFVSYLGSDAVNAAASPNETSAAWSFPRALYFVARARVAGSSAWYRQADFVATEVLLNWTSVPAVSENTGENFIKTAFVVERFRHRFYPVLSESNDRHSQPLFGVHDTRSLHGFVAFAVALVGVAVTGHCVYEYWNVRSRVLTRHIPKSLAVGILFELIIELVAFVAAVMTVETLFDISEARVEDDVMKYAWGTGPMTDLVRARDGVTVCMALCIIPVVYSAQFFSSPDLNAAVWGSAGAAGIATLMTVLYSNGGDRDGGVSGQRYAAADAFFGLQVDAGAVFLSLAVVLYGIRVNLLRATINSETRCFWTLYCENYALKRRHWLSVVLHVVVGLVQVVAVIFAGLLCFWSRVISSDGVPESELRNGGVVVPRGGLAALLDWEVLVTSVVILVVVLIATTVVRAMPY